MAELLSKLQRYLIPCNTFTLIVIIGLKKLIKVHVASALEPSEIITVNAGMNSFTPNSKYEIGDDDALLLEDDNIILDRSDNFKTFLDREMEKVCTLIYHMNDYYITDSKIL